MSKIRKLLKSMKNGGLGGTGSVSRGGAVLPTRNKLPKKSNVSASTKIKIPSVPQVSKKNPIKSIQQIQNKDIKDRKMKDAMSALSLSRESMDVSDNGQWTLRKALPPEMEKLLRQLAEEREEREKGKVEVSWRNPGERKQTKIIRIPPGPKGETEEEKMKRLAERNAQRNLEQKLKDPEFRQAALDAQAPQRVQFQRDKEAREAISWDDWMKAVDKRIQEKEQNKIYDAWVNTVDPRMVQEGGRASKKRAGKRMNMLQRRKEHPEDIVQKLFDSRPGIMTPYQPDRDAQLDDQDETPKQFIQKPQVSQEPVRQPAAPRSDEPAPDFVENPELAEDWLQFGAQNPNIKKTLQDIKNDLKKSSSPVKSAKDEMIEFLEKRCWEGYEPVPGKKAYEKGSCRPMKKKECDCENCDCNK